MPQIWKSISHFPFLDVHFFENMLNLPRNKKWAREGCQCDSRPLKERRPHVDVDVAAAKEKFQKTKLKLVHKNWMTKTHSLMLDTFWLGIVSNLDISKLHKNTLSQPKSVGKIFLFFELN